MDRFAELTAFVTVADAGSFTRAAELLDLPKSAISRRVSELERRLDTRLLNRTTRSLSLTETGRALRSRARRLLSDLEETEQLVASEQGALRGRLRLAAPMTFGLMHLTGPLTEFQQAHEGLELDVDVNDRNVDLVEEGFDMALRIGRLQDSSLIARRLAPVRVVCVASPDYLARHGRPNHPLELEQHTCLHYSNMPTGAAWRFSDAAGNLLQPRIMIRLRANSGDLLCRAAEAGLGIAHQPTFIVHRAIEQGRLVPLLKDFSGDTGGLHLVYPPGRYLSRRVRALSDFLADRFGQTPYWDDCLDTA